MVDVLINPILIWACIDSLKHSTFIKKTELQVLICVEYTPTTEMFKVKFLLFKELNLMWESENQIGFFSKLDPEIRNTAWPCVGTGAQDGERSFLTWVMAQGCCKLRTIKEASQVCPQHLACVSRLKCHRPVGKVRLFSLSRSRVTERPGVLSKATQMINSSLEFDPREERSSSYSL